MHVVRTERPHAFFISRIRNTWNRRGNSSDSNRKHAPSPERAYTSFIIISSYHCKRTFACVIFSILARRPQTASWLAVAVMNHSCVRVYEYKSRGSGELYTPDSNARESRPATSPRPPPRTVLKRHVCVAEIRSPVRRLWAESPDISVLYLRF